MDLQCETLAVQGREHYFDIDSQLYNIPLQWNFWGKNLENKVICSVFINRNKKNRKKMTEGDVYCLFVRLTKFYTEEWKVNLI